MLKTTVKTSDIAWEWIYLFFCTWYIAGIFIDGYFHVHNPALESFFTPWHAILYTGFLFTALVLMAWTTMRKKKDQGWIYAIPPGHGLSLVGALLFAMGGVGDMLWHIAFGVEADIEALLSPTHLMLAAGAALVMSGGARHFWATKQNTRSFLTSLPLTLSLAFTFGVITFMSQFAHYTDPEFVGVRPASESEIFYHQGLPILGIVLFSAVLVGIISAALRRGRLPFGSVMLILTSVVAGTAFMREGRELIPAAFVAGFIGDVFVWKAERTANSPLPIRLLSIVLPASYTLLMLVTLTATKGVWMSVHMWTGTIAFSGFAGFLTGLSAWPRSRKPAVMPKKRKKTIMKKV